LGNGVDTDGQFITRIHVSSNCSLTPREALMFYLSIAGISLIIAGICVWRGYWPVLPFTGLELLLLGVVLRISLRRGRYREVIQISDDRVIIDKIGHERHERLEFPRLWARVEVSRPRRPGHPSRLLIGSHGKRCEVGESLVESDRASLGRRLAELIGATGTLPSEGVRCAAPET
jgi:uncharacterized membrane protein